MKSSGDQASDVGESLSAALSPTLELGTTMKNDPANAGSIAAVVRDVRRERRQLAFMRVSLAMFALLFLATLAWIVPGIPLGMATSDFNQAVFTGFGLATASSLGSLLLFAIWGERFRGEAASEFLRVLFGASLLIRGRAQFYGRLNLECLRGRRNRRHGFALVVVRPAAVKRRPALGEDDSAAVLIRGAIRADDVLGHVGPDEIGVIALAAERTGQETIVGRLAEALARSESLRGSGVGSSRFPEDGRTPGELFAAAYGRLAVAALPANVAGRVRPPPSEAAEPDIPAFLIRQL